MLAQDTASRMPSIGCILVRVQGQIYVPTAGAQANQPNHTAKQGKHRCIRRLQGKYPSLPHCLFRGYPVSSAVQQVPKLCGRYVHLQLFGLFENQGQLAKNSPHKREEPPNIRFSACVLAQSILVCGRIIGWFR